nr:hypothetical protein [Myxococcales bacterium]
SDFDTVLTLLAGCEGALLACSDDAPGHAAPTSQVTVQLQAGVPVLAVVDGPGLSDVGAYTLNVAPLELLETDCADGRDLDDDGSVDCADTDCAFDAACPEVCDDGLDNDVDGDLDCADAACAFDAACPEVCDDGLDDDGDGAVDCLDARCAAEAVCLPGCPEHVGAAKTVVWSGSTLGRPDSYTPTCSLNSTASDVAVSYTASQAGTVTFDTKGSSFDTVLTALDGCGGTPLACNDDAGIGQTHSEIQVSLSAGQQIVLVIDGFATASGATGLNAR